MICIAPDGKCVSKEACELGKECVFKIGQVDPSCDLCGGLLTDIEINDIPECYCKACDVSDAPIESDPFSAPCEECGKVYLSCGFPGSICPSCLANMPAFSE